MVLKVSGLPRRYNLLLKDSPPPAPLFFTASGNILASGNFFRKLLMAPLETIELFIF